MPLERMSILLMLAITPVTWGQVEKRPLSIDDLYRFDDPTQLVVAPRGDFAVHVRKWIDPKSKNERYSLWRTEGAKTRPLEAGEPDARSPLFSPDGQWILFLSTRPRPAGSKPTPSVPLSSDAAVDLWVMPVEGGTAVPLGGPDQAHGRVFHDGFYGRVAFSPDGTRLVFVADDGRDPRTPEEIERDVVIVRPDQGEGYTGYGPAQVWVAELATTPGKFAARSIRRLTNDDVWYGDPQWSPDGKFVVVHANRTAERESVRYSINRNFDLWAIDAKSGSLKQLTRGPGPDVSPRFLDANRLIHLTVPRRGSHRDMFNLAILTLGPAGPRSQILFDHHGPEADKPPHPPAYFPLPQEPVEPGERVIYNTELGTGSAVMSLDLRTARAEPVELDGVKPGTQTFAARRAAQRALTPPSNAWLQERVLGSSRVYRWKNGEGMPLDGVLTLPPPGVASAPYKMILYPHGGPHSRAVLTFNFTVETFAAHGYAVFQPNFRGSSGYGQKFIDADRFDLGGGDMRDILSGVDQLVKENIVDPKRQFLFGTSYGGFMTCWLVGQTGGFRAAAAQNAVTDLTTMWGLSDLQTWTEWEFGGRPWEVPAAMRKHSPLTHVGNVRTPTLILHSRDDRRCPLPMGLMFHQALRARQVPTQMVIYPDEGHGIRQPRHREDVLRRTLAWFATHEK